MEEKNERAMLEREQIDYLLVSAFNAAVRAGSKIAEIYTQYEDFFVSLKTDSTPITIADREAHSLIKHYLGVTRIPLLSEEGRDLHYDERRGWDLFWLVDPLDGTEEFIKRNGEFTVNIALIVRGRPLFGVIYLPTRETIYFSDPDRGSFCVTGLKPQIAASYSISEIFNQAKRLPLYGKLNTPLRVAMSRSHESDLIDDRLQQLEAALGEIQAVEYGSSLKLCLVAEGSCDFYIRTTPTMEWDTAAGQAILDGAECIMYPELQYNKEELENPPFVCQTKYVQCN